MLAENVSHALSMHARSI